MKSLHTGPQISGLSPGADVSTSSGSRTEAGAERKQEPHSGGGQDLPPLQRGESKLQTAAAEGSTEESHANVTLTPMLATALGPSLYQEGRIYLPSSGSWVSLSNCLNQGNILEVMPCDLRGEIIKSNVASTWGTGSLWPCRGDTRSRGQRVAMPWH